MTIAQKPPNLNSSYIVAMESYVDVVEALAYGDKLLIALDNVIATNKTIERFGFTKSMEALIGHQLGSTTNQISIEANDTKRTIFRKMIDWFKKMWQYIKDFFAKLFNTQRGILLKLKKILNNKDAFTTRNKNGFEGYDPADFVDILEYISKGPEDLADDMQAPKEFNTHVIKFEGELTINRYAKFLNACLNSIMATRNRIEKSCKLGVTLLNKRLAGNISEDDAVVNTLKKNINASVKYTTKLVANLFKVAKNFLNHVVIDKEKSNI